jgi:hypothetical protein
MTKNFCRPNFASSFRTKREEYEEEEVRQLAPNAGDAKDAANDDDDERGRKMRQLGKRHCRGRTNAASSSSITYA